MLRFFLLTGLVFVKQVGERSSNSEINRIRACQNMGRRNQSEEKREQNFDAFQRVILRDGYSKASQRRIAKEAGVNQPMIHHYFSGGDEMLEALLKRVVRRFTTELGNFSEQGTPSLTSIVSFLCSEEFHRVSVQNEVFFSLIGQRGSNEPVPARIEVHRPCVL